MRSRHGFTLIELMMAVTTIGIIIAMAMPNLLSSRRAANEAQAIGMLRSLVTAETQYHNEHRHYGDLWDLCGYSYDSGWYEAGLGFIPYTACESWGTRRYYFGSGTGVDIQEGINFTATMFPYGVVWDEVTGIPTSKDGSRYFYVDGAGVIKYTRDFNKYPGSDDPGLD